MCDSAPNRPDVLDKLRIHPRLRKEHPIKTDGRATLVPDDTTSVSRDVHPRTRARRVRLGLAALAFALSPGGAVLAAEVAGVSLADEVSVGGRTLVLNGAGIGTKVFFRIYVGSLYVPRKVGDVAGVLAQGPRRIQMNFLRKLSVSQLVGGLVGGLNANNTAVELAAVRAPTDQLLQIMQRFQDVEMKEGDVLTLDFIDGVTTFAVNGKAGGVVSGQAFNRALTRIWLGDRPAHPALKKAMLGE